ncbi:putative cytochrome protein [Thermochaetoides thermophila DSM 1495]|uniref:Complex III subunit 9 n=1 Tax=Chaetomium thermophilum (strain DSM 1495 / CBS 144.50 / IMI 039719) TaxID=759272 RepID=G0SC94_CHATD|nr:putative cytochrome protein [Thermochaetoides thermophila DSM 1495]EGS19020.1 putative cytochrome protein [Thermochaetoides thermophila DSM 1495]
MPRTKPSFEPHVQLQPISFGSGYFRAAFPAAASGQFCSALLAPGPRTQTSKVEISRSDPLLAVFLALRPRNVTWHVAPQIGILNSHNGLLRGLQASPLSTTPSSCLYSADPVTVDYVRLLTCSLSTLFRRNWTMLGVVFASAFAFELGFNTVMDRIWDNHNKGRQWKDIRHKYVQGGEDEE